MGRPGFIPAVISAELGQDLCRALDSNFLESGYANWDSSRRVTTASNPLRAMPNQRSFDGGHLTFTKRCGEFSSKE